MKITAKVLTITATAILLLSLAVLLICILGSAITCYYPDLRLIFSLRIPDALNMFGLVVISGLLCFTICSKRIGVWSDIVALIAIVAGGPIWDICFDRLLPRLFQMFGMYYHQYMDGSTFYYLWNLTSIFLVGFATALLLVACGMSIAYKCLNKAPAEDTPPSEN